MADEDEDPIDSISVDGGASSGHHTESVLSERQGPPAAKGASRVPSAIHSRSPPAANIGGSSFGSGSTPQIPASRPGSTAPSPGVTAELLGLSSDMGSEPRSQTPSVAGGSPRFGPSAAAGTPPRPSPRAHEAAGPFTPTTSPGPGPGASPVSAGPPSSQRPTLLGGAGRPASASPYLSNELDSSDPSLPRRSPSSSGSPAASRNQHPLPAAAGSSGWPSAAPSPAGSSSGALSPQGHSRPPSIRTGRASFGGGDCGGGDGGGGGRSGFSLNGSLGPPEAAQTPAASRAGQLPRGRTSYGGNGGGGWATGASASRPGASQRQQVQCHIPTPFELFRLYDADLNGRVTEEEFYCMLRDLDGLPGHYAPQDDPEHRLVGLREKKQHREAQLAARESRLALTEAAGGGDGGGVAGEHLQQLRGEVTALRRRVGQLGQQVEEQAAAARELERHPDEGVRVTAERRQHRDQWRKWVAGEFARADLAGNGILSVDEFYMYFYSKLCFRFPVMRTGVNPGALLFNIFVRYCSFGRGAVGGRNEDMLSHQFARLCRDADLVTATLTRAAVDIIYCRARAADESLETYRAQPGVAATARMYYTQFLFALDKVAEKRRSGFQEVVARILARVDPLPEPSSADFLILSGSELQPGAPVPEYLLRPRALPSNAASLRSLADNDLVDRMKKEAQDALRMSLGLSQSASTSRPPGEFRELRRARREGAHGVGPGTTEGAAATGQDGAGTPAPTASTPAAPSTSGVPPAPLHAIRRTTSIASSVGGPDAAPRTSRQQAPTSAGTPSTSNVYGDLPPPSLDPGVLRERRWERPDPGELVRSREAAVARGIAPVNSAGTMHLVRGLDPDALMAALKRVFEAYCGWGGGVDRGALDKRRFAKALRDALLVAETGPLPARKAEGVYGRVLPISCRALNFMQFIEALRHVALIHRLSLNEVMERLVATGGPQPGA